MLNVQRAKTFLGLASKIKLSLLCILHASSSFHFSTTLRCDQWDVWLSHKMASKLKTVQGCSKTWAPGCVKLGEKVVFINLLQAGERNFFTPYSHNLGSIL